MPQVNRQILIDSLPDGKLTVDHYRLEESSKPEPSDGEVLCRTLAISIGAGTRAGLQGSASYAGAPKTGIVMNATGVARVEASRSPAFQEGDLVVCPSGWQDYSVHQASKLYQVSDDIDIAHHLGALGITGLTAYFGLHRLGQPKPGETVLVSAAAGSAGHLVTQMAKIADCDVVGISSTPSKCEILVNDLSCDRAVSYRSESFRQDLKEACRNGVDIYFDNTGGPILETALRRMNIASRIVCCGVVSQYDTAKPAGGPSGIPGLLVNKRIRMQGFLVFDYLDEYQIARDEIKSWIQSGKLKPRNDQFDGLESAPSAFVDLLAGGNIGTRTIRIAE